MINCPKCGKNKRMSAIHGRIRTVTCLSCGQGWKTGINGKMTYKEIVIEFGTVLDKMIVMTGKRKVRLAPIVKQPTAYDMITMARG